MATKYNVEMIKRFLDQQLERGVSLDRLMQNPMDLLNAVMMAEQNAQSPDRASPFADRTNVGKIYDQGPFSEFAGDIISDVTVGGTPLTRWIPTRTFVHRNENISHIPWIAPEGFTGASDYATFLAGLTEADCEYGFGAKMEATEYTLDYERASVSSDTLHGIDFIPQKDYANSANYKLKSGSPPLHRFRGPQAGQSLQSDADLELAKVLNVFENHHGWVMVHGVGTGNWQWDGLSTVIALNYVNSHKLSGNADYSDPYVVDGSTLLTVDDVLRAIRSIVRLIRNRASQRNQTIAKGDMVVALPMAMWQVLAERIACGGAFTCDVTGGSNPQQASQYLNQLLNTAEIPIDGQGVPILPLDEAGVTSAGGTQLTSDIYVLVRRVGNMNILEQQYYDYSQEHRKTPKRLRNKWNVGQGGLLKWGFLDYQANCYQFFAEMQGRLASFSQTYQGRITNVTVQLPTFFQFETSTYTPDWYALVDGGGTIGVGV